MHLDSLHIATGNAGPNLSQSYATIINDTKEKFRQEINLQNNGATQGVTAADSKSSSNVALKPVSSSDSAPKNYMFNSHIRTHELVFGEPLGAANELTTIPLPPESFPKSISMQQGGYFISITTPESEKTSQSNNQLKQLKGRGHAISERYSSEKKHQKGKLVNVVG